MVKNTNMMVTKTLWFYITEYSDQYPTEVFDSKEVAEEAARDFWDKNAERDYDEDLVWFHTIKYKSKEDYGII